MEISIIYKSVTGGVVQFGLPERRVSDTMQVGGNKVNETVDILMGVALRRLENAEAFWFDMDLPFFRVCYHESFD